MKKIKTKIETVEIKTLIVGEGDTKTIRNFRNTGRTRNVKTDSSLNLGTYPPDIFSDGTISYGCQSSTVKDIEIVVEFLKTGKVFTKRLLTKGGKPNGAKVLSPVVDETEKYFIVKGNRAYLKSEYAFADVPVKIPKGVHVNRANGVYTTKYHLGDKDEVIEKLSLILEIYNFVYGGEAGKP